MPGVSCGPSRGPCSGESGLSTNPRAARCCSLTSAEPHRRRPNRHLQDVGQQAREAAQGGARLMPAPSGQRRRASAVGPAPSAQRHRDDGMNGHRAVFADTHCTSRKRVRNSSLSQASCRRSHAMPNLVCYLLLVPTDCSNGIPTDQHWPVRSWGFYRILRDSDPAQPGALGTHSPAARRP